MNNIIERSDSMKKIIDYIISKEDLSQKEDRELAKLFMYSDRDRKELEIAEKIYWWCVEEINRRIDHEECQKCGN